MTQIVTLTLPDSVFQPLQRAARATNQPIEDILLHTLQASCPSLEGLPDGVVDNLTALEMLEDSALWQVMRETVPVAAQRGLRTLLKRQQIRELTDKERKQLATLQLQADLVMLRKTRAAVLLRFRGNRIPTLAGWQPPSE